MTIKRLALVMTLAFLAGSASGTVLAQRPTPASQGSQPPAKPAQTKPGTPAATAQRPPERKPWWIDEASKKELGLTPEQSKTLDEIFTSTKDELAGYNEAFQRENKELERIITESKVERWVVARQIDKVETQRSNLNKLRFMTLYRMHQVLTPEQRVTLQKMRDRDHKDPRKRP
jgi:Spy/CpxP family protein refolding chaperone